LKLNKPTEDEKIEAVEGNYDEIKDFRLDEDGYFLIKLDRENKKIVAGFCKENNNILVKIIGSKPSDIYSEVIKRGLVKQADHIAYLGKECQKAYIALQQGLDYIQDEELSFDNTDSK
jgi:dihydropteroate synthase